MFNTYQTDDYGFAAETKKFGLLQHCLNKYLYWGGRYFSFSLNALNPAGNLSLNWIPKIFPIIFWANLLLGFFLNFCSNFKLRKAEALKKSFIAFLFYTVVLASLSEHYFWLTGAVIYQLPHIFGLYFLFLNGIKKPKTHHQIFKYFLLFAMMGSNEIVALFLLLYLLFHAHRKRNIIAVTQFVFGLIFFCIAFFAPGNSARINSAEASFLTSSLKKIAAAIANGMYVVLKVSLMIPIFLAVFQTEILKIKQSLSLKDCWKFPVMLMIVLSFTGVVMLGSERSFETILLFSLLTLSVLVSIYFKKLMKFWPFSLLILFVFPVMLYPYKGIYFKINYNLFSVANEILTTDLKKFETQIYDRHQILNKSSDEKIVLEPIKIIPKILYFDELGTAENRNYVNQQLEAFYGKKRIELDTRTEE